MYKQLESRLVSLRNLVVSGLLDSMHPVEQRHALRLLEEVVALVKQNSSTEQIDALKAEVATLKETLAARDKTLADKTYLAHTLKDKVNKLEEQVSKLKSKLSLQEKKSKKKQNEEDSGAS